MIDKLQPRQIFSLDDQSNNSTPGNQQDRIACPDDAGHRDVTSCKNPGSLND